MHAAVPVRKGAHTSPVPARKPVLNPTERALHHFDFNPLLDNVPQSSARSRTQFEGQMICIVDYGLGNLGSIRNMLKKIGAPSVISSSPADIRSAEKLILPGVGAFDAGMQNLRQSGLIPVLEERVFGKHVPMLGICLGMQLMAGGSAEGDQPGLGWIDAQAERFDFGQSERRLPVPHMGWTDVEIVRSDPLTDNLPSSPRFYFVHSYHVRCAQPADELLRAHYGIDFTAGFSRGNLRGVQFHPEKSHKFGMALLKNFVTAIAGVETVQAEAAAQ